MRFYQKKGNVGRHFATFTKYYTIQYFSMNDNDNQNEGGNISWSWNRSSKLKKRRRVFLSPGRDNAIPQGGGKNISMELNTKETI